MKIIHGKTYTKIYSIWRSMKKRCLLRSHVAWKNYGGRGITVCERWLKFAEFYADMGNPPRGKQLDRIDNDGNYEPSNCRWATIEEQMLNRRNTTVITVGDETRTLNGWATYLGVAHCSVKRRFERGLPLTTPLSPGRPL